MVKTCKSWRDRPHIFTDVKPLKTFYILLHWGELFQGSYSLKFEPWYSLYIADQDTARYSLCSARENCVSWAEPLKCTTDNLFSSRVFLLNLWPVYEICPLKNTWENARGDRPHIYISNVMCRNIEGLSLYKFTSYALQTISMPSFRGIFV